MKVLVPLPYDLSRLEHGRNLRIVHLLRRLANRCELTCLVSTRHAESIAKVLPHTRIEIADSYGDAGAREAILGRLPRAVNYFGCDPALPAATMKLAAQTDAVVGFDLPALSCLLAVESARLGRGIRRPALVADLIDDPLMTYRSGPWTGRWSLTGFKTAAAIHAIRHRLLRRLDALIAVAPADAASLSRASGCHVAVIPNGVELPAGSDRAPRSEPLVVFTGAMSFPPNVAAARWMATRVWPVVLDRLSSGGCKPDGIPTLALVGADPAPAVKSLAVERPDTRIVVTGRVPDLNTWLLRARVAVAPMVSGSGMKNKVLEACAAGCPVVSTPLGGAGLPQGESSGILIGSTADALARQVAGLLLDGDRAARLGAAARAMVASRFDWSRLATLLHDVLATAAAENSVASTAHSIPDPACQEVACHAAS